MPPYEVHTPWYSPRYQEGLQLSVIQSTGRDCYYSWFADHSDSPLSKTAVDQYASGKWQNNFPQMKHCTQGIILVTYRCCTSAHSTPAPSCCHQLLPTRTSRGSRHGAPQQGCAFSYTCRIYFPCLILLLRVRDKHTQYMAPTTTFLATSNLKFYYTLYYTLQSC